MSICRPGHYYETSLTLSIGNSKEKVLVVFGIVEAHDRTIVDLGGGNTTNRSNSATSSTTHSRGRGSCGSSDGRTGGSRVRCTRLVARLSP